MTEPPKKRKRRGERADGRIQVSVSVGFDQNGKRIRKSFYGYTRAEAMAKRDEFIKASSSRSRYSSDITVADWVDEVLARFRGRVHEAYKKSDAVAFNRIKNDLGHLLVADVLEADLQESLDRLDGMSYSTVEKYYRALQLTFQRARKNKIIKDDPSEDLVRPRSVRGTHRALARWEVDLILENYNHPDVRVGLWVLLMLLCGLRRGEMIALDWSAVNLEARTLMVCQTAVIDSNQVIIEKRAKTDAGLRTLPICDALLGALSAVPPDQRHGFVCTKEDGSVLTETAVRRGLDTFMKQMERVLNGYPVDWSGYRRDLWTDEEKKKWEARKRFSFRAHDLRHTFATSLYDAGVPVKAAQYFLGHADIKITLNLYTHLSREREAESRLLMVEYFNTWLRDKHVLPASDDAPFFLE